MSNPETELDTGSDNTPRGMSDEEILKRLEPKEPDEPKEDVPPHDTLDDGDNQQADPDESADTDTGDDEEGKKAEAEEAAWLAKSRKITVQGEELEVTADEAFKGYMRQQDYTRKTQEAAQLTQQVTQESSSSSRNTKVVSTSLINSQACSIRSL
jgi:hypothetical protein